MINSDPYGSRAASRIGVIFTLGQINYIYCRIYKWPTAFKSPFRRLLPLCGRSEVKSRDPRQSSPRTIRHGEYSFGNQVLCAAKTAKIKKLCGLCFLFGEDRHTPSVFPHSSPIFLDVRDFTSEPFRREIAHSVEGLIDEIHFFIRRVIRFCFCFFVSYGINTM